MEYIDVSNIDPAAALASLYNASRPSAVRAVLRVIQATSDDMSIEEARVELECQALHCWPDPPYFDYLRGRVMKVEINGKTLDPRKYDRDNGIGAAQRVIENCRTGPLFTGRDRVERGP